MEEIIIDDLTIDRVRIKRFDIDYEGRIVGEKSSMSYINTLDAKEKNRIDLQNEVPEPYKSVIFMLWGEEPTIPIRS